MSWVGQWKHVVAMVAINFAFGLVNLLLKKALDKGLNHLIIVTYRQSIAAIFLAPIAYFRERKSRSELTPLILCQLFLLALIGLTISQYLFLLGLESTSATFSCAFLNMVPVNTFILALPFGLEKVNMKSKSGRAKVLGALLCVCGALLLTLYRGMPLANSHSPDTVHLINQNNTTISANKTKRWVVGSVFLGAGSLLWSSWFLIQAKVGKKYPFEYSSTAIMSFFAAIQSAILSLIIHRNVTMWVLKGALEIISVTYANQAAEEGDQDFKPASQVIPVAVDSR
ncbi:hypothetical protein FNV43_RR18044 [Rhamnella rubrinervis]|uniref:WAT1-related protein n=1 Tax=Rhamnella rubrinervis TaxID=2594499 RepID=A0A8K0GVV7_9ROSA|nr:hypothetical protein FNV43_RR18044 [Rhamnella rubrinervis]